MQIGRTGGVGATRTPNNRIGGTLQKTNRSLRKILERLSTAQRINRASDDAAGLAVSEQLRSQARGLKMADRNVTDAMSVLDTADGAATEIEDMLQRQRELAIQARNDTLTDEQRGQLDVEFQQLTTEIGRIAEGTEFNAQEIADGSGLADGDAQIQTGANEGDVVTLPEVDFSVDALGLSGASVADFEKATSAVETIDNALNVLNTQRSNIGAMVNRFTSTQNNLAVAEVNTQAAESILRDQDMAAGLAELTRNQLLHEGGTRAFQRFNEISANHILALFQ
ncbi:MAG: flagellin [Chitinivibrionales bacterium]|nr:flagellin [Chitinivibrionales bacterium]MBD3357347.1 flagellin [Chitinivibrionales bacterium]